MTKAEVLRKAAGIVSALIKLRTPAFSELAEAHKSLGALVELTKGLEPGEVPADVATGINDVINRMESFRSGYRSNDPTQKTVNKSFTIPEFAAHLKKEIETATGETDVKALDRLHVLANQIAKASAPGAAVPGLNKAASVEDTTGITLPVFVDPAQIVPTDSTSSAAAAQSGAPAAGSNFQAAPGGAAPAAAGNASDGSMLSQGTGNPTAGNYEASKSAGGAPAAVVVPAVVAPAVPAASLDAAAAAVEAAAIAKSKTEFEGWPMDVNAAPRKSKVHFGKDPKRA